MWTAAAAALPVIVVVLVLVAVTLGALVFTASGFDSLFAVVAVEWLVINLVPLSVDDVALGFLPLLPALVLVSVLARQTRTVLADVERPGPREAGSAVAGVVLAAVLVTVLATLVVGSADSDFAVAPVNLPAALGWTVAVAAVGSGLGVWLYFRSELREALPLWVRGGLHLGAAFVTVVWAVATALVLIGLLGAWGNVANVLGIGKDFLGIASLAAISAAYLPNVVAAAGAVVVGGEAHLGEASVSVFAVSRGPLPEVPLAAVVPTTDPHWVVQGLLLVTVLAAAVLARSVAHWFRTTADAVKATWLGAVVVALVMAITPVVAGGRLGALGTVGTGSLIAAGTALLIFGVIGSATIALSLAGLTRRRERAESELARRRRRAGTLAPTAGEPAASDAEPGSERAPVPEAEAHPDREPGARPGPAPETEDVDDHGDGGDGGPGTDGDDGDDEADGAEDSAAEFDDEPEEAPGDRDGEEVDADDGADEYDGDDERDDEHDEHDEDEPDSAGDAPDADDPQDSDRPEPRVETGELASSEGAEESGSGVDDDETDASDERGSER